MPGRTRRENNHAFGQSQSQVAAQERSSSEVEDISRNEVGKASAAPTCTETACGSIVMVKAKHRCANNQVVTR
jgi:hypothetical protein